MPKVKKSDQNVINHQKDQMARITIWNRYKLKFKKLALANLGSRVGTNSSQKTFRGKGGTIQIVRNIMRFEPTPTYRNNKIIKKIMFRASCGYAPGVWRK